MKSYEVVGRVLTRNCRKYQPGASIRFPEADGAMLVALGRLREGETKAPKAARKRTSTKRAPSKQVEPSKSE